MNEHRFGYRVRQYLDQDLTLDAEKLARLKAAREWAIGRQRVAEPNAAFAWAADLTGSLRYDSGLLFSRILLPAAILLTGVAAIYTWHQAQTVQELVEIDTRVLASDLPIDAYLDQGFDVWLKRSSQ